MPASQQLHYKWTKPPSCNSTISETVLHANTQPSHHTELPASWVCAPQQVSRPLPAPGWLHPADMHPALAFGRSGLQACHTAARALQAASDQVRFALVGARRILWPADRHSGTRKRALAAWSAAAGPLGSRRTLASKAATCALCAAHTRRCARHLGAEPGAAAPCLNARTRPGSPHCPPASSMVDSRSQVKNSRISRQASNRQNPAVGRWGMPLASRLVEAVS